MTEPDRCAGPLTPKTFTSARFLQIHAGQLQ